MFKFHNAVLLWLAGILCMCVSFYIHTITGNPHPRGFSGLDLWGLGFYAAAMVVSLVGMFLDMRKTQERIRRSDEELDALLHEIYELHERVLEDARKRRAATQTPKPIGGDA